MTSASFSKKHPEIKLAGVQVPDPVFFCSIEPPSMSKQKALEQALANLAREDPSLRVAYNDEQTVLSGMGELHLGVLLQRIRREYKIEAELGPLMVAFKETPTTFARCQVDFERKMGNEMHSVSLDLSVKPLEKGQKCQLKMR